MRILPTLLALTVAAGALSSAPFGMAFAAPVQVTGQSDPTSAGLSVDIVPREDGTIIAGSDLTVAVRLANESETVVPEGTATVAIARTPIDSRDALDSWLVEQAPGGGADLSAFKGVDILQLQTPAVTAGGSVVLPDAIVPSAALPFVADSSGVYLLSVTVIAGDGEPAVSRNAVTVRGSASPPPARVALAVPITLPPAETGLIPAEDLEAYTATGGLLDRQLSDASGQLVAIGIDPRIIVSIRVLGDSAPVSALDWLERLRTVSNETFALSYADTDIAATSQVAGVVLNPTRIAVDESLFRAVTDPGADQTPTPSPDPLPAPELPSLDDLLSWNYSIPSVAWPRDGTVVAADLDRFAASGLSTTIVSSSNVSFPGSDAPPANGSADGNHILSSDDTVSTLLRDAVAAPTLAEWQADVARLSAALAAVSAQTGAGDRVMLATLGRDVPGTEFRLSSTIAAMTGSGLAASASFSDALAQSPTDAAIIDSPVTPDRTAQFTAMFASEGATGQFATVLDDPNRITGERRLSLMAVASQSWAAEPEGWPDAVAGYLERNVEILSSVVVASTNLVQTSDRNPLPIVVTNALDYPVTVTVEVTALRPIVAIRDPSVELTVPPNSQKRASIAAESIANGEVRLSISLFSATRVPISTPSLIEVTVNAGWETTATSILAVIVLAVFVLGIIRTVRRRRRIARGELEDDRAPDVRDLSDSAVGRDG